METDRYFQNKKKKTADYLKNYFNRKDNHVSYIDSIPERYKRRDYIIDRFNNKKKNID